MSKLKPSVAASTSGVVGYSTIVVPLQYISASNMAEILRPVAEEGSFVRVDDLRGHLGEEEVLAKLVSYVEDGAVLGRID